MAYHHQARMCMYTHMHAGLIVRYWRQQKTLLAILAYIVSAAVRHHVAVG